MNKTSKIESETWKWETDWQWPEAGRGPGDDERKKGKCLVNNMCKGPMVMDNRLEIDWGSGKFAGQQQGKIETTVIEQQKNKIKMFPF